MRESDPKNSNPSRTSSPSEARSFLYLGCLVFLGAGIILGRASSPILSFSILAFTAVCSAILVWRGKSLSRLATILTLVFFSGFFSMSLEAKAVETGLLPSLARNRSMVEIEGKVKSPPSPSGDFQSFFLEVERCSATGKTYALHQVAQVSIESVNLPKWIYAGSRVKLSGRLFPEEQRGWLFERGASTRIRCYPEDIELAGPPDFFASRVERTREKLLSIYHKALRGEILGLVLGVTLGETGELDAKARWHLDSCGISHIVCVSGLHVGAAAGMVVFLLSLLGVGKKFRFIAAAAAAALVMALSGFRPAAVRSFLMFAMAFGGDVLGRKYQPLSGLSLAGVLILGFNPRALFDPGFQLSFAATLGIVLAIGKKSLTEKRGVFLVCAGAQLGVIPLLLAKGGMVPVTSIIANFLVVPLVGPLFFSSWALAASAGFGLGATKFVAAFPTAISRYIFGVSSRLSRVPQAGLREGLLGGFALFFYLLGLFLLVRGAGKKGKLRPLISFSLAIFLIFFNQSPLFRGKASSRMIVFDVGQGDSILLMGKEGSTVLIDGGPEGGKITKKLQERGVSKIDLMVLTHPHKDHLFGLMEVIAEFPVGALLEPSINKEGIEEMTPSEKANYEDLLDKAHDEGIKRIVAEEGMELGVSNEIELQVLYAPASLEDVPDELNDTSIVILARIGEMEAILTGDIENEAQEMLFGSCPEIDCDVLKMPHQGARDATNPDLLDFLTPEIAVIPVGEDNPYGHPSQFCLNELASRRIEIFRTDEDGDIELGRKDGKIVVSTQKGR
ncbi:MAG: DNA internalization-related competence protein ComEC/Rec2 [Actinomycetota bacterium]|nr:DNA internalization-related competence protein ComEC/Rec2 [Actinomycetota bacterium]